MGCQLKHAVGGRIENGLTGSHMLFAQLFYDAGTGCGLVSQCATPDRRLETGYQLRAESRPDRSAVGAAG